MENKIIPKSTFKKGHKKFENSYKFEKDNKINVGKKPWNNKTIGIHKSHRKGMTYEEEYGEDKAKEIKNNMSINRSGMNNYWFGKELQEGHKIKISKSLSGRKLSKENFIKLQEGRKNTIIPTKDTSIEVKIQNFLEQLRIDYFKHKHMNIEHAYQCDIFIPTLNLVIECDGDYWHKYPTGRDIDKIRTSELIENGFKVLRLWEHEVKVMNLDKFKEKLKC